MGEVTDPVVERAKVAKSASMFRCMLDLVDVARGELFAGEIAVLIA